MLNIKSFAMIAFLTTATAAFSDTLNYKITGVSTMRASWSDARGKSLGEMGLEKTSYGVMCASVGGMLCQLFQLEAMCYSDWNTVYNQTASWEMYDIVRQAGGAKSYALTSAGVQKFRASFDERKANNEYKTIRLVPNH